MVSAIRMSVAFSLKPLRNRTVIGLKALLSFPRGACSSRGIKVFLDINGNRVFALTFGSGTKTLLAHSGWIGNYEDWVATLSLLSEDWRVVVYDHRGSGETRVSADRITAEALIDDLFIVMDKLNIEKCTLAGFSAGCVTTLRAALRHPERFEGLIFMNGTGGVKPPDAEIKPIIPPSQWPGKTHLERLEWFATNCTPEPDMLHVRQWAVSLLSRATPEAAEASFLAARQIPPLDWEEELPRVAVPAILLHGELDPLVDIKDLEYFHAQLPQSKLVVFEGTGHLPAMTRPDDVAAEINAFFEP